MRIISQFLCDACNQPVAIPDGMVIWDGREPPVSLFVVHNWLKCRTEGSLEACPLSCTLAGFVASNGLSKYFNLLVAAEDFSPVMKRFMEKGLIEPNMRDFSPNDLLRRPLVQTQTDFAVRRTHLKRSIVECVARFFEDFNEDAYFFNDKELAEAIRQDLE